MKNFPNEIPVVRNNQPLFRIPKKGAQLAPVRYEVSPSGWGMEEQAVKWVPNTPFTSTLHLEDLYASAASDSYNQNIMAMFADRQKDIQYKMRYNDFMALVASTGLGIGGSVTATWRFYRRGPYLLLTAV